MREPAACGAGGRAAPGCRGRERLLEQQAREGDELRGGTGAQGARGRGGEPGVHRVAGTGEVVGQGEEPRGPERPGWPLEVRRHRSREGPGARLGALPLVEVEARHGHLVELVGQRPQRLLVGEPAAYEGEVVEAGGSLDGLALFALRQRREPAGRVGRLHGRTEACQPGVGARGGRVTRGVVEPARRRGQPLRQLAIHLDDAHAAAALEEVLPELTVLLAAEEAEVQVEETLTIRRGRPVPPRCPCPAPGGLSRGRARRGRRAPTRSRAPAARELPPGGGATARGTSGTTTPFMRSA